MKLPANIDWFETLEILPGLLAFLPENIQKEIDKVPGYIVTKSSNDGLARYRYSTGECYWYINRQAYRRGSGYMTYLVAHELAHILNFLRNGDKQDGHGPTFHEIFKEICPKQFWHFELEYMKRFANRMDIEDMI